MKTEREKWIDRGYYRIHNKPKLLASNCIIAPPGIGRLNDKFHRAEKLEDVADFMNKHGAILYDYGVLPINQSNGGYNIFKIKYKHSLETYSCLLEFSPNDIIFYYADEFHQIRWENLIETFEVINE